MGAVFVFALETTKSQLGAVLSQQALRAWRRVTTRAPLGAAQAFLRAFPDLRYTYDLLLVRGDYVVQRYTAMGTHEGPLGQIAPSGRRATWTGINIFRIHCGRIAEVWSEVDALRRNQQLTGASPGR